ncbi:MAG: hypothetical protein JNK15_26030, partial [Planctomycetes bacterium]|nr:hypothetical protein [Planctomycetota bacterium]
HTLVRDRLPAGWRLAGPRARTAFLPDPVLLMHALAANLPDAAPRTIAESGGAAVERIGLCLAPGQVEALEYAGAVLDSNPMLASLRSMVKAGRLSAEDLPAPIVDVCLDVDVATRMVRRIHVRMISQTVDAREMLMKAQKAQRARPAGEDADTERPAEAAAEPKAPEVPKEWKDGLPVRSVDGMQVVWLEYVLRDHGKATAVEFDAAQKALLGR